MPDAFAADSVGLVTAKRLQVSQPLELTCGYCLPNYQLAYETYGTLNAQASNAVLVCHALSGNHHAAGYYEAEDKKPGWWDMIIGPGKAIDTRVFFVVALNNLGGCHGSTGPQSLNPETQKIYGADFPMVTVADWVTSQKQLAESLGIKKWQAVIGGSLGGMQALQWSIQYPDSLAHAIVIASAAKLSTQNIAFNEVARQAIMGDEHFHQGHYLSYEHCDCPKKGLGLARMIGHITYLSDSGMGEKFGRDLKNKKINFDFAPQFQIESYLHHQAEKFARHFDANTYLLMTRALDYFDPAQDFAGCLEKTLETSQCGFFLAAFSSDWRFCPARSREIVDALIKARKPVSYLEIESPFGHDAFLVPDPRYLDGLKAYFKNIAKQGHLEEPSE